MTTERHTETPVPTAAPEAELRLPDTRAFFDVFNVRIRPTDAMMVFALRLLDVWVRHYDGRRPRRPMPARLAQQMDTYVWAIDCCVEDALRNARDKGYRVAPDAQEMPYSYGELVSLLAADFVQCLREQMQPDGITEEQVRHHIHHWEGFNSVTTAVAIGQVRLKPPAPAHPRRTGK